MDVRGVAGQQHPSFAVGSSLPSHIGESRNPAGTVDSEIGPVRGGERLAEVAQGRFVGLAEALFRHEDSYRPPILQPAQRTDTESIAA
jgi:hypothetical protein